MIANFLKFASLGLVVAVSVLLLSGCAAVSPDAVHPFVPVAASF